MTYDDEGGATVEQIEVIDLDPPKRCPTCQCKASMKCKEGKFWCKRHCPEGSKAWKKPKRKWSMLQLTQKLYAELDARPSLLENVDVVALENQPVNMNPHLKSVQVLLFGYFVVKGVPEAYSVSAAHKYRVVMGAASRNIPKDYKVRKLLAITHADQLLRKLDAGALADAMMKHTKKDDLADAVLINGRWAQQRKIWDPTALFVTEDE